MLPPFHCCKGKKERLTTIMKSKKHTKQAALISVIIILAATLAACDAGVGGGNQNVETDIVGLQSSEPYSSTDPVSEQLNFSDINGFWAHYRQAVITSDFETLATLTSFPLRSYGMVYPNPVVLIERNDFERIFSLYLAEENYAAHLEEDGTFTFNLRTNFEFIAENEFLMFLSFDELAGLSINEVHNSGSIENGIARAMDEMFEIVDGYWRLTSYFSMRQSAYEALDISAGQNTDTSSEQAQNATVSSSIGDRPAYITIGGEQFSTELTMLSLPGALTNEDLIPLRYMTNLESLWLGGGPAGDPARFTDLSPIAGLTNLRDLALDSTYLSDLAPLANLTNLIMIQAWGSQIADLTPLAGLTNLDLLSIAGNHITDLSPVSGLTNLTVLDLSFGQITDIAPLSGLTNLRRLNLDRNQITDVSPLANLANAGRSELEDLNLRENQISDISPLAYLVSLEVLWLDGNPIADLSPAAHVPHVIFEMQ